MESADLWKPQCRLLDHISELSKSSSDDLVPLLELESTYNGPSGGENVESQEMNLTLVARACGNELEIYIFIYVYISWS